MTTARYCAHPKHLYDGCPRPIMVDRYGTGCFVALMALDWQEKPQPQELPCVPALLVPVTQWDKVQALIVSWSDDAANYRRKLESASYESRVVMAASAAAREACVKDLRAALAAVQGIPVDTEAGNG